MYNFFGTLILVLVHSVNSQVQVTGVSSDVIRNIYFQFYEGPTEMDYSRIPYLEGLSISNLSGFNTSWTTVFHFPGWGEQPNSNAESVNTLATAFLKKANINFVVIDYSKLVVSTVIYDYLGSVMNTTMISKALAQYFDQYVGSVQPLEKLHMVSHSLGSQILSRTANKLRNGKFKWLTGLDPAGPIFEIPLVEHLSSQDGDFVDIIHTDGYQYGDGRTIGTVDFFPNRGYRYQPACVNNKTDKFCSHHMSWRFYALSILDENMYPAVKCMRCISCDLLNVCMCNKNDIAYMGYGVNKNARGTYFLKTEATYPYKPV